VPSFTVGDGNAVTAIVHVYGVSLGSGWSGLPPRMATDYVSHNGLERLDHTVPVYIDWEISTYSVPGQCAPCSPPNPTPVIPPRPLANEPWFAGFANAFVPQIAQVVDPAIDPWYTACVENQGLEEPVTTPLTADGKMRVRDIHGGIGGSVTILWERTLCASQFCEYWFLVLRWDRVQSYTDENTGFLFHPGPGATVTRPARITIRRAGCSDTAQPCHINNAWSELFATEWVSTDVSYASRRAVDAGDLSAVASAMGSPVVWGYDPPVGQGPASRNYYLNTTPFDNAIDFTDLIAVATDLGKVCGVSKSGAEGERDAIMAWFGYVRTGEDVVIVPGEEPVPGWALADAEQNRRAIADPYGYRSRTAATVQEAPWARVKQLFR